MSRRLIAVSGPSGVGKGPIIEWTKKAYPNLCQVKVRKEKTERYKGTEDDLGFNGKEGEFYSFDCRGTEQRIYLNEIIKAIDNNEIVLLEMYYKAFDFLKQVKELYEPVSQFTSINFDITSVFISPLDMTDIENLSKQDKRLEDYLPDLMLDSLIKRAERDGKSFTHSLLRELEMRAEDSVNEIKFAHNYRQIIPNHSYESDSRWKFPILVGEPLRVVKSLKEIIERGNSDYAYKGEDYKI